MQHNVKKSLQFWELKISLQIRFESIQSEKLPAVKNYFDILSTLFGHLMR